MNTDAPRPNTFPSAPNAGAVMSATIAHHHHRVDISPPPAASSKLAADTSIHQQESPSLKSSSLEKDTTKCAPRSRSSSTSSSHGSAASVPSRIRALLSTSSTGTKKDEEKTLTQPDDQEDVLETENGPSSSVPPCTHANEMLTSSSSYSLSSSGAGAGATAATILAPRKRELHYFSDQYRGWLNLLLNDISDSETDDDDDDEMDAEQEQHRHQQQEEEEEEEVQASVEYTETLQRQARRGSYRASHEEGALAVAANIVASMMDCDDDENEAPAMLPQ